MKNCGLPKGYEDQCCLNRSGMCTLDTADYRDIDRAVGMRGCGFIGVNDRYLMWKYGVPYKDFNCGHCQYYRGETHGKCVKAHAELKDRYNGAHACKEFKKQEEEVENVAKKTYYTKCGREFQKNSTAVVTGYEIDLREDGTISEVYKILKREAREALAECVNCPFKVSVKEGWPQVHKKWECRAGSEKPNHTTEWTGSLEDKNTIQIHSLNHQLMEQIKEFCENHSDLGAGYNADHMADCRRTLAINCSSNKKGMAAKKELIEKFFPETDAILDERFEDVGEGLFDKQKCRICGCTDDLACEGGCYWVEDDLCSACAGSEEGLFYCDKDDCPFNDRESGCQFDPTEHRDEQWEDDIEMAVNRYACENSEVVNIFDQIVEETAIEVSEKENTCAGCCYVPVKGKDTCNTIYANQKATGKCGWYNNPKTGEMGDLLYKLEYGEDKPIEKEEEYPVNKTKESVINSFETVTELTKTVPENSDIVTFDYSSVDNETANFLQDKAEKIAAIRMRSVMAIGKELKEAHEKLANNKNGTYEKWVESIGITHKTSRNYINAYDYILKNFQHITDAEQIQPSLLFAISKPSAPQELQDAVLAGDITTHKEYQELLKAKQDAEFHYETVKKSYERLERVNTQHYEGELRAQQKVAELEARIKELSSSVANKNEILMLQNTIKQYEAQVAELNEELFRNPIEAQAATIKEVVPPEVQAELQRLTTENRLLSEKQTSTTKAVESIVQGSAQIRAQLDAYHLITKSEIQEMKDIPQSVSKAVYELITDLKLFTMNLESLANQFRGDGNA